MTTIRPANLLYIFLLTTACTVVTAAPFSNYDYIEIQRTATPIKSDTCANVAFSARLTDHGFELASSAGQLIVHNELEEVPAKAIVGDFWGTHQCFIALKTAESYVNKSYDVYTVSATEPPRRVPGIPSIVNPDFIDNTVISNYRDAARWHKEKICYPHNQSPYLCEKRDSLDDGVERVQKCTVKGDCEAAKLVFSASGKLVNAQVTRAKATILQISSDGDVTPLRSYLVRGDRIRLLDFKSSRGAAYYQFEFNGKRTTAGWLNTDDVTLIEWEQNTIN